MSSRRVLPPVRYGRQWEEVIDTAGKYADGQIRKARTSITLDGKSMVVLRAYEAPEEEPDASVAASVAAYAKTPQDQ